jgi:hypothetical protein
MRDIRACLLPSQKLFAILRDIYVQLDQGYTFITALKLENIHLFYALAEISVLATSDTICLVIQIPLRTERKTYKVYIPIPVPTLEPNLGKFIQIQAGEQRIAISSDRRNYMILPADYMQNCKGGNITIFQVTVPVADRTYETCLSKLFFEANSVYKLCSREILRG